VKENIGLELTESLAMFPTASVSGYYFANPKAKYFGVGKIAEDQLKDYAERKNIDLSLLENGLSLIWRINFNRKSSKRFY
jgi:5-methyltetrahydrofolate--homocysteine methyltransferase